MKKNKAQCTECPPGTERAIVYGWGGRHGSDPVLLCAYHNQARKAREYRKKRSEVLRGDEKFYKSVWDSRPHRCENCGTSLEHLKSPWSDHKHVFSHLLSKQSQFAAFRHDPENINLLCLSCHTQWETGDRTEMNIYTENYPRMIKMGWVPKEGFFFG